MPVRIMARTLGSFSSLSSVLLSSHIRSSHSAFSAVEKEEDEVGYRRGTIRASKNQ